MENNQLLEKVKERANSWLNSNIDDESKESIRQMLEHNENELIESFYRNLEFGTGGLRGIMGAGTNRVAVKRVANKFRGRHTIQ